MTAIGTQGEFIQGGNNPATEYRQCEHRYIIQVHTISGSTCFPIDFLSIDLDTFCHEMLDKHFISLGVTVGEHDLATPTRAESFEGIVSVVR